MTRGGIDRAARAVIDGLREARAHPWLAGEVSGLHAIATAYFEHKEREPQIRGEAWRDGFMAGMIAGGLAMGVLIAAGLYGT